MSSSRATASSAQSETLRMAARLNPSLGERAVVMTAGLAEDRGIDALAVELAECLSLMRDGPVLIADLGFAAPRRPAFQSVGGRPGMRDVAAGVATLDEVVTGPATPGVRLVGAGATQMLANPFLGPDMASLTQALRERYSLSFLVVDPLLSGPTGLRLSRAVDGVILGVASGIDRRDDLTTTLGLLDQMGALVYGCVLVGK